MPGATAFTRAKGAVAGGVVDEDVDAAEALQGDGAPAGGEVGQRKVAAGLRTAVHPDRGPAPPAAPRR